MKVYDKEDRLLSQDAQSFEYDESLGYLTQDKLLVKHHHAREYQPEIRNERPEAMIVLKEYRDEDGNTYGMDVEFPVVQEEALASEAWDEEEDIMRYVAYTRQEWLEKEIMFLQAYLQSTDYLGARIAEGSKDAEDYAPLIKERQLKREAMRVMQEELDALRA